MDHTSELHKPDRVALAVDIVAAYVSTHSMRAGDLPALLSGVHGKLIALDAPEPPEPRSGVPTSLQIRRSITPDALISFIDGRPYKTLKRHLTVHGLDPDGYRRRFGLARDYPMVAPNYAAQRSQLARDVGFGQWRRAGRLAAQARHEAE